MSSSSRSLRQQAAEGGRWTAISAIASVLIQFAQLAILGRLLGPNDFGLMAMMMVVIGLAGLLADFGVTNFLVQTRNLSAKLFSALLLLCLVGALGLAALVALTASWVADYFRSPVLASLLPALGIVVIATALGQPFFALLQRELRFRQIAIVETVSGLAGLLVATTTALMGYGVWSLIGGQLALAGAKAAMCGVMAASLIQFEWKMHWRDLSPALRFGNFQMGERLLNFAGWNIDKIVVGRALGEGALGVYSVAYQLVLRPFSILNPVFARVALPLLSRVQDDNARLCRGYLEMTRLVALVAFPIYLLMILASDSIVYLLLGNKWADAADLVAILGGLGFIYSLGNPIGSLLLAKGRADWGFYYNLLAVFVYMAAVLIGSNFGVEGVAYALVIAAAGVLFPLEFWLRWRLIRMSPWVYLRAIGHLAVGAMLPLIIGLLALHFRLSEPGRIGVDIVVGLLAVLIYLAYLWFTERGLLRTALQLIFRNQAV